MSRSFLVGCLLLLASIPAHAGRACQPASLDAAQTIERIALADRARRALDDSGSKVALLARAGQDLREFNLNYSHLGLAHRVDGYWRITHKLNDCGSADAAIYRQGLAEFFLDSNHRNAGAILIIEPTLARQVHELLKSARWSALHTPVYSVAAYPFATRYQQSNQWALETLAMAAQPHIASREAAQAWLRAADYRPSRLYISTLTRLGGRLTKANVAFDDHPARLRFSNRIDTVTVDSVFEWMLRTGMAGRVIEIPSRTGT